jgi:UDP-N-acetylmuramyl pentapeptide phosphotransferase/UDP-N-acetylglucosamine-1-phosphate transferase
MMFSHIAFLFSATAFASFAATGLMLAVLKRRGIFDIPNERSSHNTPTPRGGGFAMILVSLMAWGLSLGDAFNAHQGLFIAAIFLGGVSWVDDLKSLSARVRLLAQIFAVSVVFWVMPMSKFYFQNILPLWLDNLVAVLLWVWFINLFNFMDGIDGISVVEASSIGIGIFFLMTLGVVQLTHGLLGLSIAAAAFGFLWWNWEPAKVFLGDVGSIPLGFLLGWLLLDILASQYWPVAVILPLYYLADATITLGRRGWRGERIWRAHREHFYQQATARGLSHSRVSLLIAGANVLLIGFATLSLTYPLLALIGAFAVVGVFLLVLRGSRNGSRP